MKKNTLWGVASLLAAGVLLFEATGCDTGNDEYIEETPTTAYSYDTTSVYDGAIWDFSGWTAKVANTIGDTTIGDTTETAITGEIGKSTESSSDDTTLVATNFKGIAGNNTTLGSGYLQASKASTTLATYTKGYYLTLMLGTTSDIYIYGTGAGAAASQRYIAIADADDTLLVYKDNLASGTGYDFQVQAAPAGDYKIYMNGSGICKIDLSEAHTYKAPAEITELVLYQDDAVAADEIASFEAYETTTFAVYNVISDDEKEDMTADAVWTSSDTSVATVSEGVVTGVAAGTAIIRARIGRFYEQRTVTVTASTKTRATFFAADNMPDEATTWASASDSVKTAVLTPTISGGCATVSAATLTWSDTVTDFSDAPTLAASGSATDSYKFGLYWKDSLSATTTADTTVATLTFTVTPASGTVYLNTLSAQTYNGKGNGGMKIKLTAGDGSGTISSTKADSVDSVTLGNIAISEATDVTVEIQIASGKKEVSFGFEDLALAITTSNE